ncbi:hypothetical protein C2E23DRAFT_880151 [Lenzites betulinus]|nr:hypothetical protein C2E23DRAFT_880151 [Lenzites betulinus]
MSPTPATRSSPTTVRLLGNRISFAGRTFEPPLSAAFPASVSTSPLLRPNARADAEKQKLPWRFESPLILNKAYTMNSADAGRLPPARGDIVPANSGPALRLWRGPAQHLRQRHRAPIRPVPAFRVLASPVAADLEPLRLRCPRLPLAHGRRATLPAGGP